MKSILILVFFTFSVNAQNLSNTNVNVNLDTIYTVAVNKVNDSESISLVSESLGITSIDSRGSKFKGSVTGATSGQHFYRFNGNNQTVDLSGATTNVQLLAGANTTISGQKALKNIAGNIWNSSTYSTLKFDPNNQDFAVTWEIESTTGTIREIIGLSSNPTSTESYTNIDYGVYQVNNYFYSRVYESGTAVVMPGYTTFYFNVGDRVGIRCVKGVVTYFVDRAGTIIDIYTSTKKATSELYFKAAMNRGLGESGASEIHNPTWLLDQIPTSYNVSVYGNANNEVSDQDRNILLDECGMVLEPNTTYDFLQFTKLDIDRFKSGGILLPIDYTYLYTGFNTSITNTITF